MIYDCLCNKGQTVKLGQIVKEESGVYRCKFCQRTYNARFNSSLGMIFSEVSKPGQEYLLKELAASATHIID